MHSKLADLNFRLERETFAIADTSRFRWSNRCLFKLRAGAQDAAPWIKFFLSLSVIKSSRDTTLMKINAVRRPLPPE